eukprot:gene17365-17552_t
MEVFNRDLLSRSGIDFQPVQENQSLSKTTGTVRGLHFQRSPFVQAKLVRVLRGRIFDVVVDIRVGSATFGKWVGAELSADGGDQIFIPGGFAHGFCTLTPDCEIAYLVDNFYSPECDGAVLWNDPAIGIHWPDFAGAVLSDKDARALPLERESRYLSAREADMDAVNEGASRREAAARVGVSAASAVRWCARLRDTGDASPKKQGGDRVSHRIEAHSELILSLLDETRDQTLFELHDRLAQHG